MKNDWQTKNLGDLCRVRTGRKDVNEGNPDGEFPFFTCAAEHTFSDNYSFDTEALLIAGNGDVGKVSYYNGKFEAYQRTYVLSDFIDVLPRFLFLILDGKLKETVSKQKLGNTMPYIKVGMLTDFHLPVPPLAEQQRIVGLLDEAFKGIATAKANAEKNLQNARALFESHLQSLFTKRGTGWLKNRLEECFRLKSGDGLISKEMKGGGYSVYGGNGIAGTHDEFNLSGDNVIIGRVGALCGNARHITEEIWLTDNAFKVVDQCFEFDGAFLTYLLNFKDLRSFARQAAQPVISNSSLKDVTLTFPQIREQKRIAATLDDLHEETQRLAMLYERKLAALEALKKSLLHQAFSGEL